MKDENIKKIFEDIKKIFTVAWVKERKILVGTLTTIIVAGLIFFIVTWEDECTKEANSFLQTCVYFSKPPEGTARCFEKASKQIDECKKKE